MSQHVKIAYMKVIILAGGSGTRLWPLSRENYPKQFLKIFGDKSLLLMTYERALKLANHEDIVIISHQTPSEKFPLSQTFHINKKTAGLL